MILDRKNLTSRTAFRSVRYRTTREGSITTADPAAAPFFRIKKNSLLESTMGDTAKLIDPKFNQTMRVKPISPEKAPYIESFNSMMSTKQYRPFS